MAYQLVMKAGPIPGKVFTVEKSEITLGRDVGSDVFINEPEVSRRHARLSLQSGNYILEDMGSTNGTFVNGQRVIGLRILQPGDIITLGENVSLTFELASFDPNVTTVSTPGDAGTVKPHAAAGTQTPPPARPAYTSQPALTSVETFAPEDEEAGQRPTRPWFWVGCGCLVVLLCMLGGGIWLFDYLNLYCTPPFRDAMVLIGAACP